MPKDKSPPAGRRHSTQSMPSTRGESTNKRASKRRLGHISKACNGCRRRKMRCDGGQPSCAICQAYNEECVYNQEEDGRKVSRPSVVTLESRIKALERCLVSEGREVPTPRSDSAGASTDEPTSPLVNSSLGRLKIDEKSGELLEYGPTSFFAHADSPHVASPEGPTKTQPALLRPVTQTNLQLPSPELDDWTHDETLRLFFHYFNTWCMWADERRFLRDMLMLPKVEGSIIRASRTAYYSPLLHYAILSLGVSMLNLDRQVRDQLAAAFAKRAKDLLEEEAESATLSTTVGIFLLGSYYSGSGRQNIGYIYSGIALRLVQALGLSTDCSYWVKKGTITDETRQARYRVFGMSYIQDKLWSIYVGRGPSLLISMNPDLHMSDPVPEDDELPWDPNGNSQSVQPRLVSTPGGGALDMQAMPGGRLEPVKGWRSTTWVFTYSLATVAERVLTTVYTPNFNIASSSVQLAVSEIDDSLDQWYDSLPSVLSLGEICSRVVVPSHIIVLHMVYYFIVILLHRPWFSRVHHWEGSTVGSRAYDSVRKCENAASQVVQLLNIYRRCPGLRYCCITLIQVTFAAGTVHLLSAANSPRDSPQCQSSLQCVENCIAALGEMSATFTCATQAESTLNRLLTDWYQPSAAQRERPASSQPTAPSVRDTQDIEILLRQNPSLIEQLQQLGWAPPSASTPATMSSMGDQNALASRPGSTPGSSTAAVSGAGAGMGTGTGAGTGVGAGGAVSGSGSGESTWGVNWDVFAQLSLPQTMVPNDLISPFGVNSVYQSLFSGSQEGAQQPFESPDGWSWGFGVGMPPEASEVELDGTTAARGSI